MGKDVVSAKSATPFQTLHGSGARTDGKESVRFLKAGKSDDGEKGWLCMILYEVGVHEQIGGDKTRSEGSEQVYLPRELVTVNADSDAGEEDDDDRGGGGEGAGMHTT